MRTLAGRGSAACTLSLLLAVFAGTSDPAFGQRVQQVTVTFANETTGPISLFWLNPQTGREELYSTIPEGMAEDRITFTGHIWVMRDRNKREIARATITRTGQKVIARATASPAQPPGEPPEPTLAQVTLTNPRQERLLLMVRDPDGLGLRRILVSPGETAQLPAAIGAIAIVYEISNGELRELRKVAISQEQVTLELPGGKAPPAPGLGVLNLKNERRQSVRYEMKAPNGSVKQAVLAAGAAGALPLPVGTVVKFFDENSRLLKSVTVGVENDPITLTGPRPVQPDPEPDTSTEGPTYWLGRKQGGSLVYDVQAPEFFIPLMKTPTNLDGGKRATRRFDGKEYTFYTQSFTWDGAGSGPRSQAIAIKFKDRLAWKVQPEFTRPENRVFLESLLSLGVNTFAGTQWHDAIDVSVIEAPGNKAPGVKIALNGLGAGGNEGAAGPGPEDVASSKHAPTMAADAAADGSLAIGWQRSDGKIFVSTYHGPDFSAARHVEVSNALPQFGGFTRDPAGNGYILTAANEDVRHGALRKLQRSNMAYLHKIDLTTGRTTLLADLNSSDIYPKWEIYNPIGRRPARLVYGAGIVAATFGHGNYGADNVMHETGALIGVTTNGQSAYRGGAENHYMDFRMMFDGQRFVRAQEFDQGIAMSTLSRDSSGQWKWSGDKHVVKTPNPGPPWGNNLVHLTRMGQIVTTRTHYLLPYAYDDAGWAVIGENEEWAGDVQGAKLMMLRVPKQGLEDAPNVTVGSWPMAPGASSQELARPTTPTNNIMRPRIVKLSENRFVILYEEWSAERKYSATYAMIWDGFNRVSGPQELSNARVQRSTDAFLLPRQSRAGFIAGDPRQGRIVLFTVDENLALKSHDLALPDGDDAD